MKRYPVLLLLLALFLLSGLAFSAFAESGSGAAFFRIDLSVTVTNTGANANVTYTAKLNPPPDAPKLINFYTAPVNQPFPNSPVASVWTEVDQVAKFSFNQKPGSYQAIAIWADGPVKSNIVTYIVP